MKATVKSVENGDTVVVAAGAKPGAIPAEKRITLSSVLAPKLVKTRRLGDGAAAFFLSGALLPRYPFVTLVIARWLGRKAHRPLQASQINGGACCPLPPPPLATAAALQGRRDGSTRDEPFAWQAREFLRKLCVGKVGPVSSAERCQPRWNPDALKHPFSSRFNLQHKHALPTDQRCLLLCSPACSASTTSSRQPETASLAAYL